MFCGAVTPGQIPVYAVRLVNKEILISTCLWFIFFFSTTQPLYFCNWLSLSWQACERVQMNTAGPNGFGKCSLTGRILSREPVTVSVVCISGVFYNMSVCYDMRRVVTKSNACRKRSGMRWLLHKSSLRKSMQPSKFSSFHGAFHMLFIWILSFWHVNLRYVWGTVWWRVSNYHSRYHQNDFTYCQMVRVRAKVQGRVSFA